MANIKHYTKSFIRNRVQGAVMKQMLHEKEKTCNTIMLLRGERQINHIMCIHDIKHSYVQLILQRTTKNPNNPLSNSVSIFFLSNSTLVKKKNWPYDLYPAVFLRQDKKLRTDKTVKNKMISICFPFILSLGTLLTDNTMALPCIVLLAWLLVEPWFGNLRNKSVLSFASMSSHNKVLN